MVVAPRASVGDPACPNRAIGECTEEWSVTPLLGPRPALAALVALGFLLALHAPLALADDDDERSWRDDRRGGRLEQHDHDDEDDRDDDDRKGKKGKGLLGSVLPGKPPPPAFAKPAPPDTLPIPVALLPGPGELPPAEPPAEPTPEAPTQATQAPTSEDDPGTFTTLGVMGSAVRHLMVIGGVALMVAVALSVLGRRG